MGIKESPPVDGVKEYTLESWTDFLSLTSALFAVSPAYIYRGQAKYDWQLESGLDRLERRFPRRKNLGERNPEYFDSPPLTEESHLHAFKNALRGRRGPNPPVSSDDEYWRWGSTTDWPLLSSTSRVHRSRRYSSLSRRKKSLSTILWLHLTSAVFMHCRHPRLTIPSANPHNTFRSYHQKETPIFG